MLGFVCTVAGIIKLKLKNHYKSHFLEDIRVTFLGAGSKLDCFWRTETGVFVTFYGVKCGGSMK